jgi:hypothetical protein
MKMEKTHARSKKQNLSNLHFHNFSINQSARGGRMGEKDFRNIYICRG